MRAPSVLLRFPGLFAALAGGALLLAVAAAAFPLFLSASQSSLLRAGIADPNVSRYGAGIFVSRTNIELSAEGPNGQPLYDEMDAGFRRLAKGNGLLGPTVPYIFGAEASVTEPSGTEPASGPVSGTVVYAAGALDHVQVISGTDGDGVWIPDLIANAVGAGPGDRIRLAHGGRSVDVTVDGVYQSLYAQPRSPFWLRWSLRIYLDPRCPDCGAPPQPILADRAQALALTKALGPPRATFGWDAPLADPSALTIDGARALSTFSATAEARVTDPGDHLGRLFRCCGTDYNLSCCTFQSQSVWAGSLPEVVLGVDQRTTAMATAGRLLQGAAIVVALIVLAAAGAFVQAARRTEAGLLYAQGVGWPSVAVRSGLESLLPCALGGVFGLVLGASLVRVLGPDGPVARSADARALRDTIAAIVGALLFLGAVSAVSYLRHSEHHRTRFGALARLPWELGLAAIAIWLFARIHDGGAFSGDRLTDPGTQASGLLLIFPVVFIAAFGAIAGRLFAVAVRWIRARSERFSPSPYLAIRRLGGAPDLTRILIAASALCLGIFVQSQVMVGSLRATVDAKAKVYVGSDVQGRIAFTTPVPARLGMPFTKVARILDAGALPGGAAFDMLAIDPTTFGSAAFWRGGFADVSLDALLRRLTATSDAGRLSAIVVAAPGIASGETLQMEEHDLKLDVVGRADAFPGMTSLRPLIVVNERALEAAFADGSNPLNVTSASNELWVRGDQAEAAAALAALRYPPYLILTADEVEDIPVITTVIQTFLVLNALGLAAALLVMAGMLMYLQARERSQVVSYGLSLRMGMTERGHRRALALELGAMLGAAFLAGAVLALIAVSLVIRLLDPLSTIPPGPLFVAPIARIVMTGAGVLALAWLGGWITSLRTRRVDLGEVMRLAN